jgi:hypothetical protein
LQWFFKALLEKFGTGFQIGLFQPARSSPRTALNPIISALNPVGADVRKASTSKKWHEAHELCGRRLIT